MSAQPVTTDVTDLSALDPDLVHQVDLYSEDVRQDFVPHLRQWRAWGSFYTVINDVPSAVFTRTADIREVYRDAERFTVRKPRLPQFSQLDYFNGEPVIVYVDAPQHDRLRRLIQPAFLPGVLKVLEARVTALVETLLDRAEDAGGSVDFVSTVTKPMSTLTLLTYLLGIPEEDHHVPTDLSNSWHLLSKVAPGAPKPQAYLDAWDAGIELCERLTAERRREPQGDLIGSLVAAEGSERLTSAELFTLMLTIMAAGLTTISTLSGAAIYNLARHPDQWALVRADPRYATAAVEETLRTDPPGLFSYRFARTETEHGGLRLPQHMPVYVIFASPGYDEAAYPDPYSFDITRTHAPLMVFGDGIHRCIGAPIARFCGRTLLTAMARRYPELTLTDPTAPMEYWGVPGERALRALHLTLS